MNTSKSASPAHTENITMLLSLLGISGYLLLLALDQGHDLYKLSLQGDLSSALAKLYHGDLQFSFSLMQLPLLAVLILCGLPLLYKMTVRVCQGDFGADLLAGLSIVTSLLLHEYLAGSLVVLMLSSGVALESYAVRKASSVLDALAKRMPSIAHRKHDDQLTDIATEQVNIGDSLLILPHEICPVDGTVTDG